MIYANSHSKQHSFNIGVGLQVYYDFIKANTPKYTEDGLSMKASAAVERVIN